MKKVLCLLLAAVLVFAFAACGGSGQGGTDNGSSDFEWTRTGHFIDENDNYLMILPAEDEEHEGLWAVTFAPGDEMHGWFIPQEGETLHGDLTAEGIGEDPYIVTISEEGDGILLVNEEGDEFHLAPMEVPERVATIQINTEGLGEISYAADGEEPEFEEGYPYQSAVVNVLEGQSNVYTIAARPSEGYKFVKWTKNGEDFSTEDKVTFEVTEDAEYIAVFEME
ncbi:MAG: hypothetical protein IKI86_02070 [Firmicutes bacterium]|nr:hypothetical protein [Clostridiales bacterium]MBQ6089150.1 hypothetical protein [Bacillota bacterium]MBR3183595.1 hypothetical protein [Bacillota bacterium]MBR3260226.1 hypothetical protein [Bacillota bacterium]MBR3374868.1 hypothetical protein [Bacillota bacterium]